MTEARQKLQALLRELFQFDCADLDFGIYRIMNHKRTEIERFIEKDLLDGIARELDQGALSSQAQAASQLSEAGQEVRSSLGVDAISPEGDLSEQYRTTPLGQRYLELREQAATYQARPEQETHVFNHLYAFFSRYYQDGDFISKRRYSRRERYAIPYNGEEVYLHWANKDQYYVKSGEYFTDYTFRAPGGVTAHFKLQAADVEQNNVKGEKRFFIPLTAKATWEETAREVIIPFEYRPLTEQEGITYGTRDQQEKIIAETLEKVPTRLKKHTEAVAALMAERRRNKDGEPVSYLEHHLRQYTRRNTSDFFIHKDLRGFLERELDFYLKNEVLNIEELLAGDDQRAEGWLQLIQVIRRIALRIIAFLAQIEEFQKRLWEKKKFVLSTEYCMTLDRVPEAFYPEIARNQAQIEEWERLFHIQDIAPNLFHKGGKASSAGKKRGRTRLDVAFLKAHPTLVLDTRLFDQDFKDRLLATFDDLDEQTGGLLVHSENFQALNLLLEKHRERVRCIYIDPPYNTGSDEFLYRDNYQHSSWLTMMGNRLRMANVLLASEGLVFVHIDEREQAKLEGLMQDIFGTDNSLGPFIWLARVGKAVTERVLQVKHEYVMCARKSPNAMLKLVENEITDCRYKDERGGYNREQLRQWGGQHDRREDRPTLYFRIPTPLGVDVYPKRPDGSDGCWRASREQVERMLAAGDLDFVRDTKTGDITAYRKVREGTVTISAPSNILNDCGTSATATMEIKALFLDKTFDTAKPVGLAKRCISLVAEDADGVVVDYFAGSGSTGHAVINLNREDGGRRKFVLVEMADYFDIVLLPRIKKVTFTPEWKDGKPKRMATAEEAERSPRIVKYQRLENYEDALNNIAFDGAAGQKALDLYGGDYLLRYMLDFETRDSETLLNVEKLESPFSYTLRIHRDGETQEQLVDLPETFNYLIGLRVKTQRVHHDGNRRYLVYRGANERSEVVVIWRDTKGWTQADLERDKQFILEQKLTEGADEVYVNGDSFVPGAKALDPVFKRLMLAEAQT